MIVPPPMLWEVSGSGGTIDGTGLFTALSELGGPYDITATSGLIVGHASVTISNFIVAQGMSLSLSLSI